MSLIGRAFTGLEEITMIKDERKDVPHGVSLPPDPPSLQVRK